MNKEQIKILNELKIDLDEKKAVLFDKYARIFLKKNSRVNLISKNDEKFLFEKHIFDSLAINLFQPLSGKSLLDIGTGGGFPSVPLAILYDELNIYPLDSIRKKINVIEEIKNELDLKNLFPICERVENITEKYDYVTARAIAPLDVILKYAVPKLKESGFFIAYKSKKAQEEIKDAQKIIKKFGLKIVEIIEYNLPLTENHQRNLIIFQR
jgi:16S rRNA (guanine527-N7)-methyltransferase